MTPYEFHKRCTLAHATILTAHCGLAIQIEPFGAGASDTENEHVKQATNQLFELLAGVPGARVLSGVFSPAMVMLTAQVPAMRQEWLAALELLLKPTDLVED